MAVARALAVQGREVLILEGADAFGTGTSSRNSEVIHAGIYYPRNSLKARFCVAGRDQLYAFCQDHGVSHRRCGKLIVATSAGQLPELEKIRAAARANGVELDFWSAEQACAAFHARGLAAAVCGAFDATGRLALSLGGEQATVWDLGREPLTGLAR